MYVYIRSEPGLWTVGFYAPNGNFVTDSDHDDREEAARRAAYLNGAVGVHEIATQAIRIDKLEKAVASLDRSLRNIGSHPSLE